MKRYKIDPIMTCERVALLACKPTSLFRKRTGSKRITSPPTTYRVMDGSMLIRMVAPISEPTKLKTVNNGTKRQTIFPAFQNLYRAVTAAPSPASRSVAIAACGGRPRKISTGIESKLPPPTVAPIIAAATPMRKTAKRVRVSDIWSHFIGRK